VVVAKPLPGRVQEERPIRLGCQPPGPARLGLASPVLQLEAEQLEAEQLEAEQLEAEQKTVAGTALAGLVRKGWVLQGPTTQALAG
jgi:hypothetical protein